MAQKTTPMAMTPSRSSVHNILTNHFLISNAKVQKKTETTKNERLIMLIISQKNIKKCG
jgi:hypothetical protein